jgi:hypothetical protein
MKHPPSGQSPTQPDHFKPKGRFTGERLKVLRPDVYRRVVDLLAEPREHVPYDHICRLLHVSEHTVKAIERSQAIPIAERKELLLDKALRIAAKAADRIEDQIDTATITQATIAFGVATEKAQLLTGAPFQHLDVTISVPNILEQMAQLAQQISQAVGLPQLPAIEAKIVSSAPVAGDRAALDGFASAPASQ